MKFDQIGSHQKPPKSVPRTDLYCCTDLHRFVPSSHFNQIWSCWKFFISVPRTDLLPKTHVRTKIDPVPGDINVLDFIH